jgi:hypothetical protein
VYQNPRSPSIDVSQATAASYFHLDRSTDNSKVNLNEKANKSKNIKTMLQRTALDGSNVSSRNESDANLSCYARVCRARQIHLERSISVDKSELFGSQSISDVS